MFGSFSFFLCGNLSGESGSSSFLLFLLSLFLFFKSLLLGFISFFLSKGVSSSGSGLFIFSSLGSGLSCGLLFGFFFSGLSCLLKGSLGSGFSFSLSSDCGLLSPLLSHNTSPVFFDHLNFGFCES